MLSIIGIAREEREEVTARHAELRPHPVQLVCLCSAKHTVSEGVLLNCTLNLVNKSKTIHLLHEIRWKMCSELFELSCYKQIFDWNGAGLRVCTLLYRFLCQSHNNAYTLHAQTSVNVGHAVGESNPRHLLSTPLPIRSHCRKHQLGHTKQNYEYCSRMLIRILHYTQWNQ